jgi:hypothetical protein
MKTTTYGAIAQYQKRVPGDRDTLLQHCIHRIVENASKITITTTLWYNRYIEVQETPTSNSRYFDCAIPGVAETPLHFSATPGIPATAITLYLCGRNSKAQSQNIQSWRHNNYVRFGRNKTG